MCRVFWVGKNIFDVVSAQGFIEYISLDQLSDFLDLLPFDKDLNIIDYIKIDVQGLDINVLKSAKNYLRDHVVYVTAEPEDTQYYGADNNSTSLIVEYMLSIGFMYINHPKTKDPTFLNKKFESKKDLYIWQNY